MTQYADVVCTLALSALFLLSWAGVLLARAD
jgi:hypothetical protein